MQKKKKKITDDAFPFNNTDGQEKRIKARKNKIREIYVLSFLFLMYPFSF